VGKINKAITKTIILFVKAYKYVLSPFLGHCCRFHPTCSTYAIDAFQQHGCLRGFFLALRRMLCCHPWHSGGFDPVPEK